MEVLNLYNRRTAEIQGNTKYWIERGRSLLKALFLFFPETMPLVFLRNNH